MQFYYGSQMPLRILDETEFWKEQEAEHTIVMRELMTDLEKHYIDGLNRWEEVLESTHQQVRRFITSLKRSNYHISPPLYQQVMELVTFCLQESVAFTQFCRQIKTESQAAKGNHTAKVVIDHIIDESEYFMGIAQTILYEKL
ncbi:DUF2935 domain-containing protein [Virgibacillus alimentarius]|uniref:DUF2935 domain-containing protein n=1 Tax=Virgibacillus alimentarius TaxID=698769 RepID=A0ABS4S7E8_9BACI|nr:MULTISPECIES: DUF2935 domain-containing protein [Virgibacillus]MBP2257402.1 hypothetical protein [Virgibacillus alimentarius]HLR67752.1 DUF2935 domain-containing protein [Virgibacillus sp.]